MSSDLFGVVVNYRLGPREQYPRECILQFPGINSRSEASQLIGRKVSWTDGKNNTIIGVIVAPHGNNGLVRARFRRGLPGQALGTEVKIIG
ncbi:MAG: 50S ribosomal protein L35ae [Candidatus Bathyarchaeia archaeon]